MFLNSHYRYYYRSGFDIGAAIIAAVIDVVVDVARCVFKSVVVYYRFYYRICFCFALVVYIDHNFDCCSDVTTHFIVTVTAAVVLVLNEFVVMGRTRLLRVAIY